MTILVNNCAGIVLCGGESRRMGQSKAWLPFHGQTMLELITTRLQSVLKTVIVVAAPDQELPTLPEDIEIVRDEQQGRGPLQGIAAGLRTLQGRAEAAYISSCDVPLLQTPFVLRMIELIEDNDICVPQVEGRYHPLAAVYRVSVIEKIDQLLSENRLRPFFLFEEVSTRTITEEQLQDIDPTFQSLRNVNTPEEYERVLHEE